MTANDAHCVEPKCQCVAGTMRSFAHWASHEQQKCKIANFHTLGISNKHVHKTGPCAPKTRICACALCAIGLRWHAAGIRQNKVQGTVGNVGKLIIDNYTSSLRTRASQMQQKNVQRLNKMRFPSHSRADQVTESAPQACWSCKE